MIQLVVVIVVVINTFPIRLNLFESCSAVKDIIVTLPFAVEMQDRKGEGVRKEVTSLFFISCCSADTLVVFKAD